MDQRDSDLKSLIDGITALTEDLKPVEHIGRYNRLHGRRQKLIFALLNHESSEAGLTQLLNHEDAALRGIGSFAQGLFEAKGTAARNPTLPAGSSFRSNLFRQNARGHRLKP